MSTAAQLAREEADRTEAEEAEAAAEEEPTPEGEPEPEPTPEPAPPTPSVDGEKIEKIAARYDRDIRREFGDLADSLVPCTHCGEALPGYEPPPSGMDLKQAPDKEACPVCEGMTSFYSGAKAGEFVVVPCSRCNGKGFIEKAIEAPTASNVYQYTPPAPTEPYPGYGIAFVPVIGGQPDQFERPAGHPYWGLPADHGKVSA